MVSKLENTNLVEDLFDGWNETLIWSCLQKVMGQIYVTELHEPKSVKAHVGCFSFFAGEPSEELVRHKENGFEIMTPENEKWAQLIENCYGDRCHRQMRYAIKKNTKFNKKLLVKYVSAIPQGYEIKRIDEQLYDKCLGHPQFEDFVSSFDSKEHFMQDGMGIVILKNNAIVSGASSYTAYKEGIEIEVDTLETERRKKLATVACAALILECLEKEKYPSWDAQNMNSVHLAEKLGYEYSHEYPVYEVN